ncbi:MAG: hypothetical protein ACREP9_09520, partial [Candidatus Dormibacteraceae bacterium]
MNHFRVRPIGARLLLVAVLVAASACAPHLFIESSDAVTSDAERGADGGLEASPFSSPLEFSTADCSVPLEDGGDYVIDQSLASPDLDPTLDSTYVTGQVIVPAYSGLLTTIDVTLEAVNGGEGYPLAVVLMTTRGGAPAEDIARVPVPVASPGSWVWYSLNFTPADIHIEKNALYAIQLRSDAPSGIYLLFPFAPKTSCDVGLFWEDVDADASSQPSTAGWK